MSRLTPLTTTRLLKRFRKPWAISPSTRLSVSSAGGARRRLVRRRRLLLVLRIEDGLHALLLAALDHAAILGEIDGDALAGHHVVLLPHARIADEDHALLGVVVLGAARRADLAIPGDDLHVARGHGAHDP